MTQANTARSPLRTTADDQTCIYCSVLRMRSHRYGCPEGLPPDDRADARKRWQSGNSAARAGHMNEYSTDPVYRLGATIAFNSDQ